MGLGWTHNHNASLTKISGTPNTIIVQLPNGGQGNYTETTRPGHYDGVPGVGSVVDWNSTTNQYTLTALDKSTYVFDSTGKLLSHTWPSGNTWTYSYDPTSGKLTGVADGYGHSLQLTYVSNPGQYNNGQLWRVGDQNATGLSGGSPSGIYVEFAYTPGKNNGVTVSNPKALLLSVPDGALTLASLLYTLSGSTVTNLTQQRGIQGAKPALEQTDYAFQPNGLNVTTEMVAGRITTRQFDNGVYAGAQDPAGNMTFQVVNFQYRPNSQTDPNGHATQLN